MKSEKVIGVEMKKVGEVAVTVVRKAIKHMHLYVQPPDGRVLVTAPLDTTDQAALFFVRENFGWVLRQREGMANQIRQTPREYVSGETHYVWGEQYFLEVVAQRAWGGVELAGNRMTLRAPKVSTAASRREYVTGWYRQQLTDEVAHVMPVLEKLTGLHPAEVEILDMDRSWGTCNAQKGLVILNLRLARCPKQCLRYVILHELCHLRHRNHGKEFLALLDGFMPDWRTVRRRLNECTL